MRPDGQGTDERVSQAERRAAQRKVRGANSLERDIFKIAVAFALIAVAGWGALYLSKRASEPDQSGASSMQQTP